MAARSALAARSVDGVPPNRRDVAMVFQSYALYPYMTVSGEPGPASGDAPPARHRTAAAARPAPPRGAASTRRQIDADVSAVAAALSIAHLLERRPAQLSGGQRQRTALGRAMVRQPQVFLMDEPLSNLDANLRVETRTEIAELHRRLKTTFIYVTHDQAEAMPGSKGVDWRLRAAGAPRAGVEPAGAFCAFSPGGARPSPPPTG